MESKVLDQIKLEFQTEGRIESGCGAQALIFSPLLSTQGKAGLQAVSAIKQDSKGSAWRKYKMRDKTRIYSFPGQDSVQLLKRCSLINTKV